MREKTHTYLYRIKDLTFVIAIVMVIFCGVRTAHALTLSPVTIEVKGNPGEVVHTKIIVMNESDTEETYYSSYANFEAGDETGSPSLVTPKEGIGTWMKTNESVTVLPQNSKILDVVIEIPPDAIPGGHFGAVLFGTTPNTPEGGLSIGAKTAILILLSVNGNIQENAGLLDFSTKNKIRWYTTLPVSFTYRFSNSGEDRVKPVGKITLHNGLYIPTDTVNANPTNGNVLPKSTRTFNVDWIKKPREKGYVPSDSFFTQFFDETQYQWNNFAFGPYVARMNLVYGEGKNHVIKNVFFFVFPWQLCICLCGAGGILWFGGKKIIKRYNMYIIERARAYEHSSKITHE